MFESQGGLCAICDRSLTIGKQNACHVDHCHKTGTVRALLCGGCNTKLGWYERFRDRIEDYIEKFDGGDAEMLDCTVENLIAAVPRQ